MCLEDESNNNNNKNAFAARVKISIESMVIFFRVSASTFLWSLRIYTSKKKHSSPTKKKWTQGIFHSYLLVEYFWHYTITINERCKCKRAAWRAQVHKFLKYSCKLHTFNVILCARKTKANHKIAGKYKECNLQPAAKLRREKVFVVSTNT